MGMIRIFLEWLCGLFRPKQAITEAPVCISGRFNGVAVVVYHDGTMTLDGKRAIPIGGKAPRTHSTKISTKACDRTFMMVDGRFYLNDVEYGRGT